VKALIFVGASVAYIVAAYFICLAVLLQCGMGPDAPVACSDAVERQSFSFAVGAIVFYAILSAGYWWPRGRSRG